MVLLSDFRFLNWELNPTCPSELVKLLLIAANPDFEVWAIERVFELISFCLIDIGKHTSFVESYDACSLAVGCTIRMLEEAGWTDFLTDWLATITSYFPEIDIVKSRKCAESLRRKT